MDLLTGKLDVDEIPDSWNDRMVEYLGLRPVNNATGALQDIHWSLGTFGYFPTYTLGNLMSVQLFDRFRADVPGVANDIGRGDFDRLLAWLRKHVHRHGRSRSAAEIIENTCDTALSAEPWLKYIRQKFGEIYGSLE
jgi:carboxypeptidase Taq